LNFLPSAVSACSAVRKSLIQRGSSLLLTLVNRNA
jgi:hypothetical protein